MDELWQFFRQDYWDYFQNNVVKKELPKYLSFYEELTILSPFEEDINCALASMSLYMFSCEIYNFKEWLDRRIPALNNKTPREISEDKNGMNWMREFLLRGR